MRRASRYFAAGVTLFLLLTGIYAEGADRSKVFVGCDYDLPPFEFLKNGKPTGFSIDLIQAVAEVVDLDIEIRPGPWSTTRKNLEQGKIDIITGMVYSQERGKLFDFSVPHTMIFPALYVRSESSILKLEEIWNKEIIVQKDDIMHEYLYKYSITSKIITVTSLPETLRLLASGKHDGALLSSQIIKYYLAGKSEFNNLREVPLDLPPQNYCFAVAEGNQTLLHKLNQGLIILKSNGRYQTIYNKWFGVYEKRAWWDTIKFYVLALALIAVSFVVSLLWSWSLKKQVQLQTAELRMNEEDLRKAHQELEHRVEARTADLAKANNSLEAEIHERKNIEAALRKSKEEYRAVVEAFDGQIYICSPNLRIEFMNKNLISRTGRDATGERCYKALHDRDTSCPWCINDQVLKGETVRWEVQSPKDNRWYYIVNTPIHRTNGSISKQAMIQDITERIEAEQQKQRLEVQNQQIQKAESLDRMAGAIAHHFNNKLHVVMGHLELALERLPGDDIISNYLNDAIHAANKAAEVSRLMLTYLGKVTGKKTLVDLSEICSSSLPLIRATIPQHVLLETDLSSPGPAIKGNTNQIKLILANIISNSWEAVGENKGAIHLRVKTVPSTDIPTTHRFPINWQPGHKEYACMEVRDPGCGIPARDIEAAFDPFFSTKFTGRGLGLSIVLGLTQVHNGAVTIESKSGQGSVVSVFFPMSAERITHRSKRSVNSPEIAGEGTVLLVDDDKIVLTLTGEMLSALGFTVITAMDGVEALEVYQQSKDEIRFVLSDFAMPRMNGLEMLTSLRQMDPGIPVILASGYSKEQVMDNALPERPQAFLEKPFGIQELKEAIRLSLADAQLLDDEHY